LLPTGISGTAMALAGELRRRIRLIAAERGHILANRVDIVEEGFPDEDDENAPGPVVTGVNVPFSGNVVGARIGLQIPATHCTAVMNSSCTLPRSKSTDRPPEVDLWIAEAGTMAAALVEVRSGGSDGGTTGHGSGGGTAPP
jgi:hypothetical protein